QQPRRLAVRVPAASPLAAEADDLAPDVWCNAGHRVQRQQSRVNAFPGRRHRLFDAGLVEPFEATPVAGVESERADAAPGLERDTGIAAVAAVTEANWTVGLQLSEQRARVVHAQFAATAEDLHTVHRQQPVATPQASLR